MKRAEIEEKYKWDLSGYFKSDEDFYQEYESLKEEYSEEVLKSPKGIVLFLLWGLFFLNIFKYKNSNK